LKNILLILCIVWLSNSSFSQIRITSPEFNFGDIFEQKGEVYTTFKLTNPYPKDTIKITSIKTSCGCTTFNLKDSLLLPQSSIDLEVSYNPEGRVGSFYKSFRINTITGPSEQNVLYLKITGNVIGKLKPTKTKTELIEYKVAPIYFYPITPYDTSYLDFNYIIDFTNDITYEIDYFQFAKVGFEINVREASDIEKIDYLLEFIKNKLIAEMVDRGYGQNRLFFNEPIYTISDEVPSRAFCDIKVLSVNFNEDKLKTSEIKLTNHLVNKDKTYLVNFKSNESLNVNSVIDSIDFEFLTRDMLNDSILFLNVNYKTPESYSIKKQLKFKKTLRKLIYAELKNEMGIEKHELVIKFDSVVSQASTNYNIQIWTNSDIESKQKINYQIKQDIIVSPLLPVYKEIIGLDLLNIDTLSPAYKLFWENLIAYPKVAKYLTIVLESSTSYYPKSNNSDPLYLARKRSTYLKEFIQNQFYLQTGDSIQIIVKNHLLGPKYDKKVYQKEDYLAFEYIKLIPVYKNKRKLPISEEPIRPYMVNYEYYFKAVDTNSFVFKKFAKFLIYEIQTKGYVELNTESSASNIPVNKRKPNQVLAYSHLSNSELLIKHYLETHLVDPNRLLIAEERVIVQGIPYHKKTPIIRYKPFQYVRFIPLNYLKN